jgi:hypothetical protein
MNVLIFSTNVAAPEQVTKVQPVLSAVSSIRDWNIDLDDCDKILRIVSNDLSPRYIETLMASAGFNCTELEY